MRELVMPVGLVEAVQRGQGALIWGWREPGAAIPTLDLEIAKRLPFRLYITTDQQDSLAQVLERAGYQPVVIAGDADIDGFDESRTVIVQVYGTQAQPGSLLHDTDDLAQSSPRLKELLCRFFARRIVLLAHWNPDDDGVRDLYQEIVDDFTGFAPSVYALVPRRLTQGQRTYWQNKGWTWIEPAEEHSEQKEIESFLLSLAEKTQALAGIHEVRPGSSGQIDCPYKHLHYFDENDEQIFFGRDMESHRLAELALAYRLVLLFGPSGAGKSSLLRAGVGPRILRWGGLPIYTRPGHDPLRAIEKTLSPERLHSSEPTIGRSETAVAAPARGWQRTSRNRRPQLVHWRPKRGATEEAFTSASPMSPEEGKQRLYQLLKDTAQREQRTLFVFVDQFEEMFVGTAEQGRIRAARALGDLVNAQALNVHVVVSIREDFLADLGDLRPWLPTIFDHRLRLLGLTQEAAQMAIAKPAEACSLHFEDNLVDTILRDLTRVGRVDPPQLQIVCHRLWDDLQEQGETVFSAARYENLGGAQQILAAYLEDALASMEERETDARTVLKALVTSEDTKALLNMDEIARRAGLSLSATQALLRELIDHRLVRPLPGRDQEGYELAHEHLVPKISSWMSDDEQQAKKVQDMLRAAVDDWHQLGLLMDGDMLGQVKARLENPVFHPDDAEIELLLRSAIHRQIDVETWVTQFAPAKTFKQLRRALDQDTAPDDRIADIRALAALVQSLDRAQGRVSKLAIIRRLVAKLHPTPAYERIVESPSETRARLELGKQIASCAMQASKDRSAVVRMAAVELIEVHNTALQARIARAVREATPSERFILGRISRRLVGRLLTLGRDKSEQVRTHAHQIMQRVDPRKTQARQDLTSLSTAMIVSMLAFVALLASWTYQAGWPEGTITAWAALLFTLGLAGVFFLRTEQRRLRRRHTKPSIIVRRIVDVVLLASAWLLAKVTAQALATTGLLKPILPALLRYVPWVGGGVVLLAILMFVWFYRQGRIAKTDLAWESLKTLGYQALRYCRIAIVKGTSALPEVLSAICSGMFLALYFLAVFSMDMIPITHLTAELILESLSHTAQDILAMLQTWWTALTSIHWEIVPIAWSGLADHERLALMVIGGVLALGVFWMCDQILGELLKRTLPTVLICAIGALAVSADLRTACIGPMATAVQALESTTVPKLWQAASSLAPPWVFAWQQRWAGIEAVILRDMDSEVFLVLVIGALFAILVFLAVVRDLLEWGFTHPLKAVAPFLPLLLLYALRAHTLPDMWQSLKSTLWHEVPTLHNQLLSARLDSIGSAQAKMGLALLIIVLLIMVIRMAARILLTPIQVLMHRPLVVTFMLSLVPLLFVAGAARWPELLLISIAVPMLAMCTLALLRPRWDLLWKHRWNALRILGGGLGCALSLGLVALWTGRPVGIHVLTGPAPLWEVSLMGLLSGVVVSATTVGGAGVVAGVHRADPVQRHSAAGILLIGPLGWVVLGAISNLSDQQIADVLSLATVYQTLARFGWIHMILAILSFFVILWPPRTALYTMWEELGAVKKELTAVFTALAKDLLQGPRAVFATWAKAAGLQESGTTLIQSIRSWVLSSRSLHRLQNWLGGVVSHLTRARIDASIRLQRVRGKRVLYLIGLIGAGMITLSISLSLLVQFLASINTGWSLDQSAISNQMALWYQIRQDTEAIAYAVGLIGGLGFAEMLIRRAGRKSNRQ